MVTLDGREGEGGGQVLRSALSLSRITGVPFRLEPVRAKRRSTGLKAQHPTGRALSVEGTERGQQGRQPPG